VALVITELDPGGAEKALVTLATGLNRAQWQPSVIALGPEGPLATPLREQGIATQCLDVRPHRPVRALASLVRALRRDQPAIVQSFLFHANIASRLAAPLAGRPWVIGGLRVAEHASRWHLGLERRTQTLSLGSVCVSEGVRRHAIESGHLDPERLVVIPNGIDVQRIDQSQPANRESLGLPADGHVALFVGRFVPQKGLDVLLDAAREVSARIASWRLVLVGDGADREACLTRIQADPLLRERVTWLGRRGDIPSLLKGADLLVLPSLWEGMPNVVLEAMAARRAVVATSVEGSVELVEPGRTGWLVPPGDSASLAEALIQAASDPDRLGSYGHAGRDRVERDFTTQAMVTAYDRLWRAILGLESPGLLP
jgi:starch synthase (maltosyl-transferring)